jgi:hypothetical protein
MFHERGFRKRIGKRRAGPDFATAAVGKPTPQLLKMALGRSYKLYESAASQHVCRSPNNLTDYSFMPPDRSLPTGLLISRVFREISPGRSCCYMSIAPMGAGSCKSDNGIFWSGPPLTKITICFRRGKRLGAGFVERR